MTRTKYLGKEFDRVDGVAKVTGAAPYAAEFHVPQQCYAYLVLSDIARGSVASIETGAATASPGVIRVFTHKNTPRFARPDVDTHFKALQSTQIFFSAQPIALVVAESFEEARAAAATVKATYRREEPRTDTLEMLSRAVEPPGGGFAGDPVQSQGDPQAGLEKAEVIFEAEYTIPIEHHNPMEPHAAVAYWQDNKLKIFDKTQDVYNVLEHLAAGFGVAEEDVEVVSPYVGGAFGCSIETNYYPFLTAMAARELRRPVKLVYTRRQMFTGHGYRPYTHQKIRLGAGKDGRLTAIVHEAVNNTSSYEQRNDSATRFTRALYNCPNMKTVQKVVETDLASPCAMRAPGAVSGMFCLESALDELSYKLDIDPLELRLINYAETDPRNGKPYSTKALRECYARAAEKFGWAERNPKPRSMREGKELIGYGMSTGVWFALQQPATVKLVLKADGTARLTSATADIGPGTYTVMTIIAAEYLGIEPDKISFGLGDTKMPRAPVQGGSWTTASVGSAVHGAAMKVKSQLLELANQRADSPFAGLTSDQVVLEEGRLVATGSSKSLVMTDILRAAKMGDLTVEHTEQPSKEREEYSLLAHGAQFIEVRVDEELGTVRVTRAVEATACGKIMNPKTSHSQEMGGVVWGIGMALTEATHVDHRYGRIMNPSLADYHVPCCADVGKVDTDFIEEDDRVVNPLGVKGMGELGMVGIPAAISNAVYHATGRRIRDLPITPDKLLA